MTQTPPATVHALWLFDVDDFDRAETYFKLAIENMPSFGGRPIAMGRFRSSERGELAPRQFYVLAEWESEEVFRAFAANDTVKDSHSDREEATSSAIRHLFDGVNLLRSDLDFDKHVAPLLEP